MDQSKELKNVVTDINRGYLAHFLQSCFKENILKVNGQDLSKASHDEAVEVFRSAKEPIVVEVLRRVQEQQNGSLMSYPNHNKPPLPPQTLINNTNNKMKSKSPPTPPPRTTSNSPSRTPSLSSSSPSPPPPPSVATASTQTEDEFGELSDIEPFYWDAMFHPPSPPATDCDGFPVDCNEVSLVDPLSRHAVAFDPSMDIGLTDLEVINGMEFDDTFDDRVYEMEYEEVILEKILNDDKVGLTLCYGSADEDYTDIFVSEIEPNSIAGRDGRIHEGDQILQINGIDVHSREQAIHLFGENRTDITLLLARPQVVQMDDGFMEDNALLDDLHADMLEDHHQRSMNYTSGLLSHAIDEEGGTTDTATTENSSNKHEKDSGVGRTDESTKNDESSEHEMENDCQSPESNKMKMIDSDQSRQSNDSFASNNGNKHIELKIQSSPQNHHQILSNECDKFLEVLENQCNSPDNMNSHIYVNGMGLIGSRKDSQSSIEREIAALNREMEHIQVECQEIVEAHQREKAKLNAQVKESAQLKPDVVRSPRMVPRMGTRRDYIKQVPTTQEILAPGYPEPPMWLNQDLQHRLIMKEMPMPREIKRLSHEEGNTSTTSAYNTGDSCRSSTPLTLELNQLVDPRLQGQNWGPAAMLSFPRQKPSNIENKDNAHDSVQNGYHSHHSSSHDSSKDSSTKNALPKSSSNGSVSEKTCQTPQGGSMQELYARYADVMYTNRANLEHTIMVQQKLFQQQLLQRANTMPESQQKQSSKSNKRLSGQNNNSPSKAPLPQSQSSVSQSPKHSDQNLQSSSSNNPQMEWVVKRRADGTRYITRRPIRGKILKERAKKIAEERCGMTTDDDAVSELKVGRYWSKEDRKRHLEKARDYKRRKQIQMKEKMETLKECDEGKREPNIVELSQRKMMKHKGKKCLDDFTTVQEMMAHSSRDTQGKNYNPLLSVTTV